MTRQEYLDAPCETDAERTDKHRRYYSQFVDNHVIAIVSQRIGRDQLLASTDEHFNDIPLAEWDKIHVNPRVRFSDLGTLRHSPGWCVWKEAARQFVEKTKAKEKP